MNGSHTSSATARGGDCSREEEAHGLAQKHYQVDTGLTHVYRLISAGDAESRPGEPIKLLEVNSDTIPSGIMPIHFGPSPASGIHFSSVIVEITPEEFEKLKDDELSLPNDWKIGELIPRPGEGLDE